MICGPMPHIATALAGALVCWRAAVCAAQPAGDDEPPPPYTGDALVRTPYTRSWAVGSSLDLERRTTALSGTSGISERASYDRTTVTVTASHDVGSLGLLEIQVPVGAIRYREPATGTTADASGLGDVALHLHRARHGGRWSSGYFLGIQVPTGRTAAMPVAGEMLPTVVQLGSGTVDCTPTPTTIAIPTSFTPVCFSHYHCSTGTCRRRAACSTRRAEPPGGEVRTCHRPATTSCSPRPACGSSWSAASR